MPADRDSGAQRPRRKTRARRQLDNAPLTDAGEIGNLGTEPFSDTYVLFVDMLGFASLVEEHGDELSQMSPVFAEAEDNSQLSAANLLAYRFIAFHRCLNQTRARLQGCFRHQLLLPRPYLVLTKPLRLDIQCQRGASVKIGWKYLDD